MIEEDALHLRTRAARQVGEGDGGDHIGVFEVAVQGVGDGQDSGVLVRLLDVRLHKVRPFHAMSSADRT